MRKLFQMLREMLISGTDAVLVSVVENSGSTPRGAGAHMLVSENGRAYGTIGGGAVEYQAEQEAVELLRTQQSYIKQFYLKENNVQDIGMVCGGDVKVCFQYISAQDDEVKILSEKVEELYQAGEAFWLVSDITAEKETAKGDDGLLTCDCVNGDEGNAGKRMAIYGKKSGGFGMMIPAGIIEGLKNIGKPAQIENGGRRYYCENLLQEGRVYIFGGGHVTQALVPALATVGFRCTVLEDREEFCRPELFPMAEKTCLIENKNIAHYINIKADDYVCIMTRGHKDDQLVQAQVLKTKACYIGVIGSRRKKATVFANLKAEGFTDCDLERIITPIGLEIQAETPEEIAVSITAQMIQIRAARKVKA